MNLKKWLLHVVPVFSALLALAMVVLTPIWALRWYREPFIGVLLEPNNVVSKIGGKDWPAREAGVAWPDQLLAVNGQDVLNSNAISAALAENGFSPVELTFEHRDGSLYSVTVTPVQARLGDLVTLFVIPYLVGLTFLAIGLWAYRLRAETRASRAFLIFAAAVSVITTAFFDMNSSHHVVLFWAQGLFIASAALAHLALVFPQQMPFVDRRAWMRFLPWVLAGIGLLPATREILLPSGPRAYIDTWLVGYLYIAGAMAFFLATVMVRIFRSPSPVVRQQSRVIIFGSTVAFMPMMVFYLLPTAFGMTQEFRASIYFPLLILLPLSVTYAILRYRLLDVDRLFSRALTYTLTTVVALVAFYGLLAGISLLIRQTVEASNPLVIAIYLLALVLGFMPLRDLVQRGIDRLFYRAPADYRRALSSLSTSLVVTPDLERTLRLLEEQIKATLAAEPFIIYLYHDDQALYLPHSHQADSNPLLPIHDPLINLLKYQEAALWLPPRQELPAGLRVDPRSYEQLGCSTFVPLRYEGKLIGFMALGPKRSGDPYTSEDLDFLTTVAGQSTLALENARLFGNLRRTLDQTLEMKNLMDDIFASISTGVITTDVERNITLFNQAAEKIFGAAVGDVIGKSLPDALPHLCPELDLVTTNALEQGTITLSAEMTPNVPARGDLYLRLSCSPLLDAYLGTKGTTIVIEDLTERRKLQFEQERIRQTFGRVVAPRIRDRLLSDPSSLRLDGLRQKATILFADLSGFTSFSERTKPETLFKVLNYYLALAANAILEEEGTLDKFMGDAVLALWNAPDPQPDHTLRALRAALNINKLAHAAHARLKEPSHHLLFRIGVTTGDAILGNVGTSELFNYTAIGDTVNLAQRLEVTAQPGQILIDQATYEIMSEHILADPLQPVELKGKSKPVQIYALKGIK